MQVEQIPIHNLKPAPYNPRSLSAHAFENLQRSLDSYGMPQPIVVNRRSGFIVGGHQRWQAAQALGWETVPVIYVDLDDAAERKLNVMFNDAKFQGEFDNDQLTELLHSLEPADLAELDYSDEDIAKLQDGWAGEDKDKSEQPESFTIAQLLDRAGRWPDEAQRNLLLQFINGLKF